MRVIISNFVFLAIILCAFGLRTLNSADETVLFFQVLEIHFLIALRGFAKLQNNQKQFARRACEVDVVRPLHQPK